MMEPQADNGTFEATRTILAPMPVLGIPEVLVDEARGLWSVRAAGAEQPSIYRCSDIRSCEVFEVEGDQQPEPEGFRALGDILANHMAVSRANAVRRRDRVFGIGVLVEMAEPVAPVRIGLWARQLKRGSRAYRNVVDSAQELKRTFDTMITGELHG